MNPKTFAIISILIGGAWTTSLRAQEKVQLQEPKQPDLMAELKDSPDGVLRVRSNEDGSFKSLVLKAEVEIEDVLGGQKDKQVARKEAEIQCKKQLAQWLDENCIFVEGSNKTVTIQTKGDSAKDAAGNTVKLREQNGQEFKLLTESHSSMSRAAVNGLVVVSSDVVNDGKSFVLIMALTQKSLAQVALVRDALAGRPTGAAKAGADDARPTPENKVNRDALEDLR